VQVLGPNSGGGTSYGMVDTAEYVAVEWAAAAWGSDARYDDATLEVPDKHASSQPTKHNGIHLEDCIECKARRSTTPAHPSNTLVARTNVWALWPRSRAIVCRPIPLTRL
jgi:hypothetical protein